MLALCWSSRQRRSALLCCPAVAKQPSEPEGAVVRSDAASVKDYVGAVLGLFTQRNVELQQGPAVLGELEGADAWKPAPRAGQGVTALPGAQREA